MSITLRGGTIRLAAMLALWLALGGCGVFEVRDSEPPLDTPVNLDPLGFLGLLRGSTETFERLDYGDLFPSDFTYHEGAVRTYAFAAFIDRLRLIEAMYPDIIIEWTRTNTPLFSRVSGSVANLDSAVYRIYLDGDRSVAADYTGYSGIGLVYRGYWAFLYWYDSPGSGASPFSFFSPDYQMP